MGALSFAVEFDVDGISRKVENLIDDKTMIAIHNAFAKIINPFVPMDEGALSQSLEINAEYVRYYQQYAHYIYMGELYLAANGSSWAKEGEKKFPSGKPLTYGKEKEKHPLATKEWDKVAMQTKLKEFEEQVKKILMWRAKELYG